MPSEVELLLERRLAEFERERDELRERVAELEQEREQLKLAHDRAVALLAKELNQLRREHAQDINNACAEVREDAAWVARERGEGGY
jgi:hypothetical protein